MKQFSAMSAMQVALTVVLLLQGFWIYGSEANQGTSLYMEVVVVCFLKTSEDLCGPS